MIPNDPLERGVAPVFSAQHSSHPQSHPHTGGRALSSPVLSSLSQRQPASAAVRVDLLQLAKTSRQVSVSPMVRSSLTCMQDALLGLSVSLPIDI